MKLTFLGATHEVTGSCTLLEVCGKRILIDCGLEQGADTFENCEIPVSPAQIDAVFLTHAHMDHSGKVPALVKNGFSGPIYATQGTKRLCEIMLRDSAHIQEFEAEWRNRKARRSGEGLYEPLYTMNDVEQALRQFQGYPYGEVIQPFPGIRVSFSDAGHLLGSASIYFTMSENGQERTLLFSGDLGNIDRPLIRDPEKPVSADYVVIESTYGDRRHGPRADYVGQLSQIIQETFDRGGNVVIPSFAIGRTQELLYLIRRIKSEGLLRGHDNFPVYVDSPLAVEATKIYSSGMTEFYDSETLELLARGINPITFPGLHLSITSEDSKLINTDKTPKVILSASGMCEAGRIRHHLKHNLWRSESTILFVGYQSGGTIGRKLVDGCSSVKLFGEDIAVHADIRELDGISGHADRDMLLNWLKCMNHAPKTVFINHGDEIVCEAFRDTIVEKLGFDAVAPYSGDGFDLATGECFQKGIITRVQKKGAKRAIEVYQKLIVAGKQLTNLISSMKGATNKEMVALTDQIKNLVQKYKR